MPRDYDSTVARIAGNIASGMVSGPLHIGDGTPESFATAPQVLSIAWFTVALARAIVAETKRTETPDAT